MIIFLIRKFLDRRKNAAIRKISKIRRDAAKASRFFDQLENKNSLLDFAINPEETHGFGNFIKTKDLPET